MNAKQMCEALLAGKKVGVSDRKYIYLNIDGELICEAATKILDSPEFVLMVLLRSGEAKIISEEGPQYDNLLCIPI